jgi:hypothetical protein
MISAQTIKDHFPQANIVELKEDQISMVIGVFHFEVESYAARSFLEIKFIFSPEKQVLLSRERFIEFEDAFNAIKEFVIDVNKRSLKH